MSPALSHRQSSLLLAALYTLGLVFVVGALMGVATLAAQNVSAQVLTMEPAQPVAGDVVKITYHTDAEGAVLDGSEPLFLVDNGFREEFNEEIPMRRTRKGWVVEYPIYEDLTRYALFHVTSESGDDTNGDNYWDLFVYQDGKPMSGAYSTRGRLLESRIDVEDVAAFRYGHNQMELANHPDRVYTQSAIWKYELTRGDGDVDEIRAKARALGASLIEAHPDSSGIFSQVTRLYEDVGLRDDANALEEAYKANPPTDEFAARFAREDAAKYTTEEKDPLKRVEWLTNYIDEWGHVSYGFSDLTIGDVYASRVLEAYIEAGDASGIAEWSDRALSGGFARGESGTQERRIAVALARHGGDLDLARDYIDQAIDVEDREVSRLHMKPIAADPWEYRVMHGKEAEYEDFLESIRAQNRAALGYIRAKEGDTRRGLAAINAAIELEEGREKESWDKTDEDLVLMLGETLAEAERHEDAFDAFRRLAMLSPGHPDARRHLKAAWIGQHGSEDGYYAAVAEIESAWRAKRSIELLEERLDEAAPAFATTYLASGEVVTGEDLVGKVVVIDFWATWCGPCLRAFPDLNKTWEMYRDREDVVFLVVNTGWSNVREDAVEFAADHDYTFPYTMDKDEAMTSAFKVQGIPTTVVLDREGKEAFRHLGYTGPDYVAELSLELDILLGEYTVATAGSD